MKWQLIENSLNDLNDPIKTVLLNRKVFNWESYMHLTDECVQDYHALDNITVAVDCFVKHYEQNSPISILVD